MIQELPTRAPTQLEGPSSTGRPKLVAIRLIQYLTNYLVSHIPSFGIRRLWYRRVLGVQFGEHAGIHLGCHIWHYGPGQVRRTGFKVGAYSRVNRNCCLDVRGSLDIGENVSISPEVTILTASHIVNDPEFRVEVSPVVLEDHVWVGTRAMIMPGITVGRGSVVAAGAVVIRDVPALTVVAGVPAKPVGSRDEAATEYVMDAPFPLFE